MFHTIGIVFDNVAAANIFRTAAGVSFKIIGEPVDTGDFEAGSGSNRFRKKCGVCHYIIGVNGENFTSHLRRV